MRVSAQCASQRSRYAWASWRLSKRWPFSGVFLACPNSALDFTLSIRITHTARQSNGAVMSQYIAIQRVQRRVINIGREHSFAEVVEHHGFGSAPEAAEG